MEVIYENKEIPSVKFTFLEEASQELIKKRDELLVKMGYIKKPNGKWVENTYAINLYHKILSFPWNGASECEYDAFFEYCSMLFEPQNYDFYAIFDEKGNVSEKANGIPVPNIPVPKYLPDSYESLVRNCTGLICSIMYEFLSGKESYLAYPNFDEMEQRIDQLSLDECMQYFLFYNRLSLRYGQQDFFAKWKDGTALQIVKRMQQLLHPHRL